LLAEVAHNIDLVVSFNYELVVETMLRSLAIPEYSCLLLKPHGSIELAPNPNDISVRNPGYPLTRCADLNETGMILMDSAALLTPRIEAYIVLPTEFSPYVNFWWVRNAYGAFRERAAGFERCIFLGLSDWPADIKEIDFLLDCLPATTEVIVANPYPPPRFVAKAESAGHRVTLWTSGPPQ
jgi:hypothetical protein